VRRVLERINDPVRQLVTETYLIEELDESGIALASEESSWTLRWRRARRCGTCSS